MAEARKETRTKEVIVTEKEEFFVLSLSREEAKFLNTVLERIGGSPATSLRAHADNIHTSLREAGAPRSHNSSVINTASGSGIYFHEYTLGTD